MGIVESELVAFELPDGTDCRVESNATGVIHLHLGRLRVELSPREFDRFVALVGDAQRSLRDMKQPNGA